MGIQYKGFDISVEKILNHLIFSRKIQSHLEQASIDKAIPEVAEKENVQVTDQDVQQIADSYRKSLGLYGEDETREFFDKYDLSLKDFSDYCETRALEKKIKNQLITDEKIQKHFVNNRADYDRVQISIIDVDREPMANELKMQVKSEGKDFHELAREHSNHQSRYKGGSLGLVGRGEIKDALEGKVFNANEGEVVGPESIGDFYRLILVEDHIEPDLDDVKGVIREQLFRRLIKDEF